MKGEERDREREIDGERRRRGRQGSTGGSRNEEKKQEEKQGMRKQEKVEEIRKVGIQRGGKNGGRRQRQK